MFFFLNTVDLRPSTCYQEHIFIGSKKHRGLCLFFYTFFTFLQIKIVKQRFSFAVWFMILVWLYTLDKLVSDQRRLLVRYFYWRVATVVLVLEPQVGLYLNLGYLYLYLFLSRPTCYSIAEITLMMHYHTRWANCLASKSTQVIHRSIDVSEARWDVTELLQLSCRHNQQSTQWAVFAFEVERAKQNIKHVVNLNLRCKFWDFEKKTIFHARAFLSASLYVSKRGAYWDRLCRDVVGRWLSRACTVAKRCILGL